MSIHETTNHVIETAALNSQISFHNIAAHIARIRLERAEQVAERMEHKMELYRGIGSMALGGPGPTEAPETILERIVDWRVERRAVKKLDRDLDDYRSRKVHGRDQAGLPKSVRQSVIDRAISLPVRSHDAGDGVVRSITGNSVAFIKGPDISGKSNLKKKIEHTQNNIDLLRGAKRATDWRKKKYTINSTNPKLGNKSHRRTRRAKRRADERFEHMTKMPISSSWRIARLNRAERRQSRMEAKIMKHNDRVHDLRT